MTPGGGNSNIFGIFTPKVGEMIWLDEHIFQMGWFNHHLRWFVGEKWPALLFVNARRAFAGLFCIFFGILELPKIGRKNAETAVTSNLWPVKRYQRWGLIWQARPWAFGIGIDGMSGVCGRGLELNIWGRICRRWFFFVFSFGDFGGDAAVFPIQFHWFEFGRILEIDFNLFYFDSGTAESFGLWLGVNLTFQMVPFSQWRNGTEP